MHRNDPWFVRLSPRVLARRDGVERLATALARSLQADPDLLHHAFAFKSDEHAFARALVARAPQLRLFRTHQQRQCGDFAAVDLSPPDPRRRSVRVLELKSNTPLQRDRGVGMQLVQAPALGVKLFAAGVVGEDAPVERLVGDAEALLAHLCPRGRSSRRPVL